MTILGSDRSVGDDVFLIVTVLIASTLLAPYGKEIAVYKSYEFIPIGQFSDIFKDSKLFSKQAQKQ